ncbi:transglutaminase family protein [Micrococcales bacterium 31B]|nr:transglutaminase family protein [Micrococcales bacterium 31B]
MSLYDIVHRTTITYSEPVKVSLNEARMQPGDTARQKMHHARLTIAPATHTHQFVDYWGTTVTMFEVRQPHSSLELVASSRIETFEDPEAGTAPLTWEQLREPAVRDRYGEYLMPTEYTACVPEFSEFTREHAGDKTPHEAAEAILTALREKIEYVPGATGVHTSAAEAWAEKKGVCQDMAHIGIAMLRGIGIPARYVSGYVHPDTDAEMGATIAGQSHAWLEWWDGAWRGYDPTNAAPVGEFHVQIGQGRDYADVAPMRGVVATSGRSTLDVSVKIQRLQ